MRLLFNKVKFGILLFPILFSCNENETGKTITNSKEPYIMWKDSIVDLGLIKSDSSYSFSFKFENTISDSLVFEKIEANCGCTNVRLTDSVFFKNKTYEIIGELNTSEMIGEIERQIYVLSNAKNKFIILRLRGNVK